MRAIRFDCVLVRFIMGYTFQFGEIAHKMNFVRHIKAC